MLRDLITRYDPKEQYLIAQMKLRWKVYIMLWAGLTTQNQYWHNPIHMSLPRHFMSFTLRLTPFNDRKSVM